MSRLPAQLPRRDFLRLAWGVLGGLAAAGAGFIGLRFLTSRATEDAFGGVIEAGRLADFPPGSVTPFPAGRFYLVRLADGGLLALHRRCTHLACVVLWDAEAGRFNCPCHGSEFQPDGAVLNPPAPRPLVRFPVIVEGDTVSVDTGTPIERDRTGPQDVVYPPEQGVAS